MPKKTKDTDNIPSMGNQNAKLYAVNQYVIPAKKKMPVSQLKKTDHLRVHEDMTIKYGIRANHTKKEKLS
jgi:hypothetical protein